jgi:murein DD-endopeptidase MepM/ murein hydrolase activator NlpD
LETAQSAALDANEMKGELAEKTAKLDSYIKSMPDFWPTVPQARVASDFGRRLHPVFRYYRMHEGLDIGEHKGDPIYAAGSGTVISAERRSGYGNLVEIDHGNGYVTRYGHCSKLLVSAGQKVNQGDEIALMGATGTATGPHLHFEVRIAGKAVNPEMFLSY